MGKLFSYFQESKPYEKCQIFRKVARYVTPKLSKLFSFNSGSRAVSCYSRKVHCFLRFGSFGYLPSPLPENYSKYTDQMM